MVEPSVFFYQLTDPETQVVFRWSSVTNHSQVTLNPLSSIRRDPSTNIRRYPTTFTWRPWSIPETIYEFWCVRFYGAKRASGTSVQLHQNPMFHIEHTTLTTFRNPKANPPVREGKVAIICRGWKYVHLYRGFDPQFLSDKWQAIRRSDHLWHGGLPQFFFGTTKTPKSVEVERTFRQNCDHTPPPQKKLELPTCTRLQKFP